MVTNDVFEVVLRIKGGSDYCTFEIDDESIDLHDLECMIADMFERVWLLESKPEEV